MKVLLNEKEIIETTSKVQNFNDGESYWWDFTGRHTNGMSLFRIYFSHVEFMEISIISKGELEEKIRSIPPSKVSPFSYKDSK